MPFYRADKATSSYVTAAWEATEYALQQIKELCVQNKTELLVVGIDNPFTVDEDVYQEYVKEKDGFDSDLPLRRLGEVLAKLSIPYVDTQPALLSEHKKIGKKIYNGPSGNLSGHLEPEGERVLASVIGNALQKDDLSVVP